MGNGVSIPDKDKRMSPLQIIQRGTGPHPAPSNSDRQGGALPCVARLRRVVDHAVARSTEVKNVWCCASTACLCPCCAQGHLSLCHKNECFCLNFTIIFGLQIQICLEPRGRDLLTIY
jgi:hypothetical protein